MRLRVVLAVAVFLMIAISGCACSKKQAEKVDETPATEVQGNASGEAQEKTSGDVQVKQDSKGVSMDWKYKNEVLIDADAEDPIDKIDELVSKGGNARVPIHFQFKVRVAEDLLGLEYILLAQAPKVTTFEILIPPDLVKPDKEIRFNIPEGVDTRLIVTGLGDAPVPVVAATFNIEADTVIVRNFRFDQQEYRAALKVDVADSFIGENLSFSGNQVEHHVEFMAQPLITLVSHAADGNYSQYLLKNVSFINNGSVSLLQIAEPSLGKFDRIELDHVVAQNNPNMGMGIDISAVKDVLVHDCELTGSVAAPLLYQILPTPQVVIRNSTVSDKVYGYRPQKEHWHTDALPVIKENLKEAPGTTFDKVP